MGPVLQGANWPVEWPLAGVVAGAVLYRAGRRARDTSRRTAFFSAGLLAVVLAVDSPVDAYAGRLFWVHMVQHVLLTMVAPPLLLLGRPWPRVVRPFPLPVRRAIARGLHRARSLGAPLPAFVLFSGVLIVWHVPRLYDLTLSDGAVHDVEHAMFFTTALLLWAHLAPTSRRPRLSDLQRVAYGVAAIVVGWGLAVVLGLASHPLYSHYAALATRPGGISALADQQIAAGIMWVPASVPLTVAVLVAAYRFVETPPVRRPANDLRPRET